jgi:hypothetical protein
VAVPQSETGVTGRVVIIIRDCGMVDGFPELGIEKAEDPKLKCKLVKPDIQNSPLIFKGEVKNGFEEVLVFQCPNQLSCLLCLRGYSTGKIVYQAS